MNYDLNHMHIIVGLGNPGAEYEKTRHNVGRVVLENLRQKWGLPGMVASGKYSGSISEGNIDGTEVMLLCPDTYMNQSGKAVAKALDSSASPHLIVIYDEVDLAFGEFKLSFGRGSGGHNGLKSVMDELGTGDFLRVRIGIGPTSFFGRLIRPRGDKLGDYVLGALSAREEKRLMEVVAKIAEAIEVALKEGKEKAMSRFN
jgi:PTH1 family peptidyl-tRNA hydrolase